MRDEHDPLEEELHSMQPCELSADVRRRIEEELAATVLPTQSLSHKGRGKETAPTPKVKWRGTLQHWAVASAGALAAACLLTAILLWLRSEGDRDRVPAVIVTIEAPAPMPARADLWTYRHALAESPEALDALLDRQAVQSAGASRPIHAFAFDESESLTR
jgi:hypothetical protein